MLNEKLNISESESAVIDDLAIDVLIKEDNASLLSLHIPSLHNLQENHPKETSKSSFILKKRDLLPDLNISINNAISSYRKKADEFSNSPTYLIRLANLIGATGNLKEEECILRNAAELFPMDITINELGENLLNQGEISEATKIFSSSSSLHGQLRLVYVAIINNDLNLALTHIHKALEIDEFDYSTRLLLGSLHFHNGDFYRAIREFRVAGESRADSSTLFTHLAASHYAIGENLKALKELRKSLALDPLNLGAQILHADILIGLKQAGKAIPYLLRFLEYEPESHDVSSRLANAYFETGSFKKCLNTLTSQLHESAGRDTGKLNNIALCYWNLKQRNRAEEIFNLALTTTDETDANFTTVISNYLLFLSEESRYNDCATITEEHIGHINQLPNGDRFRDSIVLNRIGALSRINGREDQALSETLSWLDRSDITLEFKTRLLGQLLYHYSMVEESLDKALEVAKTTLSLIGKVKLLSDEYRATVLNNIMYVCLLVGDYKNAKTVLPHVAPLVHKLAVPTATFGMYHLLRNDFQRGTELYKEAIRLSPNPDISFQIDNKMNLELAKYFIRHSDSKSAKKHLNILAKRKNLFPVIEREATRLRSKLSEAN